MSGDATNALDARGGRKPLPLRVLPNEGADDAPLVPCTECAKCCTYVGVGINTPTTARFATDVLWYLYHESTYVYVDGDGEWSVHFEARCRNLGDDLLCRIYEDRPHVCRSFDNKTCEVNSDQGEAHTFREPRDFLEWLKTNKPRVYRTIAKKYVPKAHLP
jgi:Fe-S-cluster containining protein